MADPSFFFFNDTATTEIYTLSLHDALPICDRLGGNGAFRAAPTGRHRGVQTGPGVGEVTGERRDGSPCASKRTVLRGCCTVLLSVGLNRLGKLKTVKNVLRSSSSYQLASLLLLAINGSASVLYVDVNGTNPTPPYTNWAIAATNIQDAVDLANAGDTVLVTNGVYA